MFLRIPPPVVDFTFAKFVAHVVDHSPAYETRSLQRLGCKAIDAVESAVDGLAEMSAEVHALLAQAAESVALPRLAVQVPGGEPLPVPARAYVPFFDAIEQATAERPVAAAQAQAEAELPQAAE